MSGKEQTALSFSGGPKTLCVGITWALFKRADSWGSPPEEVLIQQLRGVAQGSV